MFCRAKMSLLSQCSGVLTMRQIIPSSFIFAPFEGLSLDRRCNTRVLLAKIWHKMGIRSWQRLHPIRIIRSFQALNGSIGLLTERIEYISFLWISDHGLHSGLDAESMRRVLKHGRSSSIFKYCFLWYPLLSEVDCCCTSLTCCTCQASLNTILGGGRGVGIL